MLYSDKVFGDFASEYWADFMLVNDCLVAIEKQWQLASKHDFLLYDKNYVVNIHEAARMLHWCMLYFMRKNDRMVNETKSNTEDAYAISRLISYRLEISKAIQEFFSAWIHFHDKVVFENIEYKKDHAQRIISAINELLITLRKEVDRQF